MIVLFSGPLEPPAIIERMPAEERRRRRNDGVVEVTVEGGAADRRRQYYLATDPTGSITRFVLQNLESSTFVHLAADDPGDVVPEGYWGRARMLLRALPPLPAESVDDEDPDPLV